MLNYRIWYRRNGDPDALWNDMSYGRVSLEHAQELVEYYEEEWGNHYQYEIKRVGFYPAGTRVPCFAGIND